MGMDDLRNLALEDEEVSQDSYETVMVKNVSSDRLFGMTAAERMFVSVGCFLVTSLVGFLALLVLEKIVI